MEFLDNLWNAICLTTFWEWLAFITSMLYLILAAKRIIFCWLFAIISSGIYIYLFFIGLLYLESVLSLFYVAMAIVGWVAWNESKGDKKEIKKWSVSQHVINILISGIIAGITGYLFDEYTDQASPYIDAFTTIFSLAATFMVTPKSDGKLVVLDCY